MIATCTSSAETRRRPGAPIARSSVSAPAFCTVMMRKNNPVTNGTTSAYSRKMTWND